MLRLTCLLLALLMPGCSDDPPSRSPTAAVSDAPAPRPALENLAFFRTAGTIDLHTTVFGTGTGQSSRMEIPIDEGAVSVHAKLTWTSPGGVQDVDLYIRHPGCPEAATLCSNGPPFPVVQSGEYVVDGDGAPGSPDSPASLDLDAGQIAPHLGCVGASLCYWEAGVYWDEVAVATIDFELEVEIRSRV